MVKWTTFDPYMGLSESDSKPYVVSKFCEENNYKHFKNILIYKPKQFKLTVFFRKMYIF